MTQEPSKEQNPEQVTLPAGTVVKLNGMPFRLAYDALTFGSKANLDAAADDDQGTVGKSFKKTSE